MKRLMPEGPAGAPRLIEWTGERCVPWAPDIAVVYEHYHRYLWAQALVAGRRVLDVGSGEGFGAALLAEEAASVVGIDIASDAIDHARANYAAGNLEFRVASALDLSSVADDSIDAVVALEVIEHIDDQERVLAELDRVLAPGGLLIISTPDRDAYAERGVPPNPFHARELSRPEFEALVGARFTHRRIFSQHTIEGSRIEALEGERGDARSFRIERDGDGWRVAGAPPVLYVLMIAAREALPDVPSESTLSDVGLGLLREQQRDDDDERSEARRVIAAELEEARSRREDAVAQATRMARLADETRRRNERLIDETAAELSRREAEMAETRRALARVEESVMWRIFMTIRMKVYGLMGGDRSAPSRALSAGLRSLGRAGARLRAARSPEPVAPAAPQPLEPLLTLPLFDRPDVSIVVPVHSDAAITEKCLSSILHASGDVAYEVIVVDDAADAETKALLARVEGIRVIVNKANLNFLHSVNRGAAEARGRYIVLLNNDTQPQLGWLQALIDRVESAPTVGVAVAKLVYADGTLQEAGSIVWQDGTAWNYGRGGDMGAPVYNFARPVDYGSAAALLIRADLWREIGGFDERFSPGYWEDVDLCFAARARGFEVMYEPRSLVIHLEGGSMGTDESAGGKRHQVLNQPKFAEKWRAELAEQVAGPSQELAAFAADRRRGSSVLVVDYRIPRADHDAGSLRMFHLLKNFVEMGYRVTFLPDNLEPAEPYMGELQGMGIEVLVGATDIRRLLEDLSPRLRLVILSRPEVAPRYLHLVRRHAPDAILAYDTVDLHFLRERRRSEHAGDVASRVSDAFRHVELGLARATDVTLVVSREEQELVESMTGAAAAVVPLANEVWPTVPGRGSRHGVLFVGGFEHEPNIDAVRYLAQEVMPLVWQELPDVALTIAGSNPPVAVTELESPNVVVAGWVADLDPLLRGALVSAAPVRYGAGVKGKVTQALAAGLPVVTTTLGAEGLGATDGEGLLIGDDAAGFASRIVKLHRDADLWARLSEEGQEIVRRECSPEAQRAALERLVGSSAPDTPPVGRRVRERAIVVGNCQAIGLETLLSMNEAFAERFELVSFPAVHEIPDEQIPELHRAVEGASVALLQKVDDGYRDGIGLGTAQLAAIAGSATVVRWPSTFWAGYVPDMFYLRDAEGRPVVDGPFDYHDRVILQAFVDGAGVEETCARLADPARPSDAVAWANAATAELALRGEGCDVQVTSYIEERFREELLFFTMNHPTDVLLGYMADEALALLGLPTGRAPRAPGVDEFLSSTFYPLHANHVQALDLRFGPQVVAGGGRPFRIRGVDLAPPAAVEAFFEYYRCNPELVEINRVS